MSVEYTRVIVYSFHSEEEAGKHFEQCTVPVMGTKDFGNMRMRSALTIFPERIEDE